MAEKIQIQTEVSVETKQAKARLDSFLQNSSKWNSKMAQQLSLDVQFLFPSESEVARQFEKYRKTAQSQFKKVNWEFMYYTKNGKESGSQVFNYSNTKLDYSTAISELSRLKELRERILSGKAVSYGDWTDKDTKALDKLILNIEKTTQAFEQLQRTRSKNITRETTSAANRETKAQNNLAAAMRRVADIHKQLVRERTKNSRGGGQILSSIYRQIDLYHQLEEAARRAGNVRYADFIRDKRLPALNKQADAIEHINRLFGRQGRIMTGLQSVAARYFSIYTVANFAKQVAETTGYFQQQQVALEGILGSAAKARDTLAEIKNFALQSPFQTKELVTFTKQLAAFGVGNNDLFPTVKKLADISAGLGVDMSRIILAYGQVKSAAVLRGQELRQFTEAGIPMVQKLADKFTELNGKLVTTGEVFKLISERQVPFEMVAQVLSDMTAEGGQFYKMQENITDTTYGQLQKLKDLWTIAMDDMGKAASGPINKIIKGLQNVVKHIQPIATMVSATVVGRALGNAVTSIYRIVKALKIMRVAAAATRGVMASIGGAIGLAAGAIIGLVYNAKRKNKELENSMKEVADSYDKDTRRMISGLDSLAKKINSSSFGTKAYNDAISALSSNYGDFIDNNTIKALQGEGEAARKAADEFAILAETLKLVIQRQQDFNKLEAQGKAAAELAAKNTGERAGDSSSLISAKNNLLQRVVYAGGQQSHVEWLPGVNEFVRNNPGTSRESLLKSIIGIIENTLIEAAESGINPNTKKGSHDIRVLFAKRIRETYGDFSPELIKEIVDNAMSMSDWKSYEESMNDFATAAATTLGKISRPFKDLDRQLSSGHYDISSTADSIEREVAKETLALKALRKAMSAANIPTYKGSTVEQLINGATTDDEAFAYNILQTLDEFKNGRTNEQIGDISTIMRMFSERVGVRSGHSARIADRFRDRNSVVGKWRGNDNLANIVATFGAPTNETYEKLRNDLQNRISETEKAIKEIKPGPYHAKDKANLEEQLRALRILQGDEYYGIEDKKSGTGSGRYNRLRIVNFFDDILAMITKAEDASKKVAGVTGWTDSMTEFFQSLGDDNYMKQFFIKGGKPFDKFFQNLQEYGVTEFLPKGFSAQNIETIFRNAGWEEGKKFSAPDFQKMYREVISGIGKDVLENIKVRRNKYEEGSSERNSLNSVIKSLEEFLSKSEKNADLRWGGDEIQKKIDAAIKSLKDINSSVLEIREKRKYFDNASSASNYLRAQRFIYGNDIYQRENKISESRGLLRNMLGTDGGTGLASTYAGSALLKIINSGGLNISSLGSLLEIQTALEKQRGSQYVLDEYGNPTSELVDNNFTETLNFVTDGVKQLTDALSEDFIELMKLTSPIENNANSFLNAVRIYIDSLDRIKDNLQRGAIDDTEATNRRITATQNLYDELSGGIEEVFKNFFGTDNGTTGISQKGFDFMQIFGNGDLQKKIQNSISKKFVENKAIAEQQLANGEISDSDFSDKMQAFAGEASGAMAGASGAIAMIDMIIKAVYGAIKGIIEMAEHTMQAAEAANHRLRMKQQGNNAKGTNTYVDKDGNISVDSQFYNDNNRRETSRQALELVGTYNQHVMDGWEKFKSGDFLGSLAEVYNSIADLVRDISTIEDTKKQQKQDELVRSNERLSRSLDALEHTLQGVAGIDRWRNMTEQVTNLQQQKLNSEQALDIENSKKSGDSDKAQEYADEITNAARQIDDIIRGIQEEIFNTADNVASQLTDPLVDAFRNGENAARSWRNAVRGYIGDVLKEVLMTKVVAPKIDSLLDSFLDGETDPDKILEKFSDTGEAVGLRNELFALGDETIEGFNNLPKAIQEMIAWNQDTSELSGGIQGITEDTARTLEGLSNSMLAQLVLIQRSVSLMEGSGFAQVQVSWFNDMLNQQRAIRAATEGVNNAIAEMRNGIRPIAVQVQ